VSADLENIMLESLVRVVAFATLMTAVSTTEAADLSANVGWNSEYIFRGVPQSNSSSFVGVDVEQSGFYVGTWAADVGKGLEVDVYGGYGSEWAGFSYAVGVTAYLYTDDFDDDYYELNLNGGYGFVSADIAIGRYDNFSGPTLNYRYYTLGLQHHKFYASISAWGDDYAGEVFEVGYNDTLFINDAELFDYGISAINSNDVGVRNNAERINDTSLVLSISKAFGTE
jgi:uncharacterized protein (TIGR02001 family)